MTEIRELVERLGSGAVLTEDKMRVDLIETEALLFAASDAIVDLSSQVEALKAEVDRCHARLEIDHYFKMAGADDDLDFERVDVPMEERSEMVDGIECRDATIHMLEQNSQANAKAAGTRVAVLEDALRPLAERAKKWERNTDAARVSVKLSDLRCARQALGE